MVRILYAIDSRRPTCRADRKSGVVGRAFVGRGCGDKGALIVTAQRRVRRRLGSWPPSVALGRIGVGDTDGRERMDWTRRSSTSRRSGRRLLEGRQVSADRGPQRAFDCSGPDTGTRFRSAGGGLVTRASRGPFPTQLTARPASAASCPELADDGPPPTRLPIAAGSPEKAESRPPAGLPAAERVFHMLVNEGDAGISSNYTAVRGVLKGVGREVQVYVAREDLENVSRSLIRGSYRHVRRSDPSANGSPTWNSERCRWRRSLHALAIELARSSGRRPISGRRIRPRGGP